MQAAILAVGVLGATSVSFVALRDAFDGDGRGIGQPPLSANGEIVFAKDGEDGRSHIFAARSDGSGVRQITEGQTNDSDPVVSPDGRTIAFVRVFEEYRQRIATVGTEGGEVTHLSEDYMNAEEPAWSPDGRTIVYVTTGIDSQQLYSIDLETRRARALIDFFGQLADPTWSADSADIVFAGRGYTGVLESGSWDLAKIDASHGNGEIEPLLVTERSEEAPSWSPDGTRIALTRSGEEGDEVWTIDPEGGSETLLAIAVEASLEPELAWAPDGTSLLVSDGEWIYRVDAAPPGNPQENFVQLVQGHSPAWQPLPLSANPSETTSLEPSAEPSPEPSPGPEGRDIGLTFKVCEVDTMSADFNGDGSHETAYVATRLSREGCPASGMERDRFIGLDLDGDQGVDTSRGPLTCAGWCLLFGTPDLNRDGRAELLVNEGHVVSPVSAWIGVYGLHGSGLQPITFPIGSNRFKLEEVASVPSYEGAYCDSDVGEHVFALWDAPIPLGPFPPTYQVTERMYVIDVESFTFLLTDTRSSVVSAEALPPSGLDGRLCGVDVERLG